MALASGFAGVDRSVVTVVKGDERLGPCTSSPSLIKRGLYGGCGTKSSISECTSRGSCRAGGVLTIVSLEDGRQAVHSGEWVGGTGQIEVLVGGLDDESRGAGADCFNVGGVVDGQILIEEEVVGIPRAAGIRGGLVAESVGLRLVEDGLVVGEAVPSPFWIAMTGGGEGILADPSPVDERGDGLRRRSNRDVAEEAKRAPC